MPDEIDADKIDAHLENGVLTLRVPKAEALRPRTIKVQAK
jgi:HSP20 family protein